MHFPGKIPHAELGRLMSVSSAHVYLTYPFVLSWSLLEAMSSSCAIIGSRTAPVQEVITDGETGVLVDFFSPGEVAAAVVRALEKPEEMLPMRAAARRFAREHYDLHRVCLPKHLALVDEVAAGRTPKL